MLAIASAVVMEPRYIVFDEPTTLLDLRNARRIGGVIAELSQSAIVITHDLPLIEGFERVLVFDRGRLVADDAPKPAIARYLELVG